MAAKKKVVRVKRKTAGKKAKARRRTSKKKAAPIKAKMRGATRKPAKATSARAIRPAARSAPRPNPLRELAKRIVDVSIAQDQKAIFDLYADTIESAEMGRPPSVGLNALKEKHAMWSGMVRDSSWQARNVLVDGNAIVIEWTGTLTFTATGKRAEMREIAIHEIANGKIARERYYYDPSFMQAAQPAAAATATAPGLGAA